MDISDDLIDTFIEEAQEHLPIIEANILALEQNSNDQAKLNELFRCVHTIKGGAGYLSLKSIGDLTHSMENLLTLARSNKLHLTAKHIDVLLTCGDCLAVMIGDPLNSNKVDVKDLCASLDNLTTNAKTDVTSASRLVVETNPLTAPTLSVSSVDNIIADEQTDTSAETTTDDLFAVFIEETRDALPKIERCLMELEAHPTDIPRLNELFRYIHTVKGSASFLELNKITQLTHLMEDVLGMAKSFKLLLEGACLETLLEAYDFLARLIADYQQGDNHIDIRPVCQQLKTFITPETQNTDKKTVSEVAKPAIPEPVVAVKTQPVINNNAAEPVNFNIEAEETIRVHVKRLNKLIDLAGELVLVRNQIFRVTEPLISQAPGLKVILHNFNRITSEMQEEIMSTRMQPVGVIFNKFPRLIRQLEKDLGKVINLVTEGADVELDKTIIESLADPVSHIIRNMADHGIERPEQRLKLGKPASGTLLQKAFHESGQVVILFSDDGAGIDPDYIAAKAIQKNIITAEMAEKMTDKEKMHLIFTPGFSTAETVSAVSGRGIGMDVVRTNVEACGGSIDINSVKGKWTSITMTLPLTMAIIASLIVRVHDCRFAFPQNNLDEMVLLDTDDYPKRVGEIQGMRMLSLRGKHLPLISLADSLHIKNESTINRDKPIHILIIKSDHNRVAVIVDQIIGSEEIVVKPMPEYFEQLENISGTSILGDGSIAMIIDVPCFIRNNQLSYSQVSKNPRTIIQRTVEQESQPILIFDNNTEEHFALALSWIQRIDTLNVAQIQNIAGNEYIDYRGEQVRILRLENCLSVQKPNSYPSATANIIIPKNAKVPVALLINRVIDTKNIIIKLENATSKIEGILGSMILDGKITLFLDMHSILHIGAPDSVAKLEVNIEKAKGKRVLLVEDTPFFMRVIKECVVSAGYEVTTAINGQEGLETLNRQEFDLVLSDIEMPVMDGREMVKNIRANPRWNQLPIIALTTLNDPHIVAEGKKIGFTEWLVKLDKELVLKTLAKYL